MIKGPPPTPEELQTLAPFYRGYWAHLLGYPRGSETNPYPMESYEAKEWVRGQAWAMHDQEFHGASALVE